MTGKERAALRAQAQHIDPIIHIGRDGVTEAVLAQVEDALTARELIKCTVQRTSDLDARSACDLVCSASAADPVSVMGRRFVIYRYSPEKHSD